MRQNILLLFLILVHFLSCQSSKEKNATNDIIDLESTTKGLTLFGENLISTPFYERDIAINPQGSEIIFTFGDYKQTKRALVILEKKNGIWGNPRIMSISGKYQDIEPFFVNNGNRLFFASNRPIYNDSTRNDYNIWFSDKIENIWTTPKALDSVINTKGDEFYPSLSEKGNLFFTATRKNGIGREDIFKSEFKEGRFNPPEPLPTEINSTSFEFNAYVSPKEDLIIFSSYGRKDGLGGGDLYISRKDDEGNWSQSRNMGKLINSDKLDFCPFIDWKNRNLYFTSDRTIFENVQVKNIESLKEIANSTLNGFGNIYKISLDELEDLE